jgi:hypothetical protein
MLPPGMQPFTPFSTGPTPQFVEPVASFEPAAVASGVTPPGPTGVDLAHLDTFAAPGDVPSAGRAFAPRGKDPNFGIKIFAGFGVGLIVLLGGLMAFKIFSRGNSDTLAQTSATNDSTPPAKPEHPASPPNKSGHTPDKSPSSPNSEHPDAHRPQTTPPKTPSGDNPPPANPVTNPTPPVTPPPVTPPPVQPTPPKPTPKVGPPIQPPPKATPTKPVPTKPPAAKPVDSAQVATFRRTLVSARTKLSERSLGEAKQLSEQATKLATSPLEKDRADKTAMLVKYVGEFWGAVQDALKGLNPTDEIDIGNTKAVVVSKEAEAITIHVGGQNRHFTFRNLPSGLAVALAERWFDKSKPENKVFIGAFYAVDPKSDQQDARRLWKEASDGGIDVKDLLTLLDPEPTEADFTKDMASMAPSSPADNMAAETAMSPDAAMTSATAQGAGSILGNPALPPVPPQTALEKAERKVKDQFDEGYLTATDDAGRVALAKKLLETVDQIEDSARKYVMCREARDLAALGGAPAVMVDAVDRLGKNFRVDALLMKVDALANYPPTSPIPARETVGVAQSLIDEAIDAKRFDQAVRLAQIAVDAAKTSKSPDLMQKALARSKQVEERSKGRVAGNPQ